MNAKVFVFTVNNVSVYDSTYNTAIFKTVLSGSVADLLGGRRACGPPPPPSWPTGNVLGAQLCWFNCTNKLFCHNLTFIHV